MRKQLTHICYYNRFYVCNCNISFVLDSHFKVKETNINIKWEDDESKRYFFKKDTKKKKEQKADQKKNKPSADVLTCGGWQNVPTSFCLDDFFQVFFFFVRR